MAELTYEIIKNFGTISEKAGWKRELNLVSWNEREAKFDLRDWNADHDRMKKGITLSVEELMSLKEVIDAIDFKELME